MTVPKILKLLGLLPGRLATSLLYTDGVSLVQSSRASFEAETGRPKPTPSTVDRVSPNRL
jgi:hypothetical protein